MDTHRSVISAIALLLFSMTAFSQFSDRSRSGIDEEAMNLIPNPGFEEATHFPCKWNQGLGRFDKWSIAWTSPTETTPDILSRQASDNCWAHPKKHSEGRQSPHSGETMVGIKIYGTGGSDTFWHEYVQVEIEESLKRDSLYYAHVWANLSAKASKATNNIGIALTDSAVHTGTRHPLYITPRVNSQDIVRQRLFGWKKISGVFKATGDETHLLIGNFYGDGQTKMERLESGRDGAYYYIDDVMLRRALPGEKESRRPEESTPPPPLVKVEERSTTEEVEIAEVEYEVGTTIELKNVYFEVDKADLKPESQKELDRLAGLLFDYPYMEIEVSGHTDDTGSDSHNAELSTARAQAVVAYLTHKDVEKERLSFNGFGSTIPVADNATEEGRTRNRRVEFKVMKK